MSDLFPKMPKSLISADWRRMDVDREWEDGTVLLVAVPVYRRGESKWHYEFAVVTIHCDEGNFGVYLDDDSPWGWDLSDVDVYVEVSDE